jgi:hypothetical protein
LAETIGHKRPFSHHLTEGIVDTLAIMGARGACVTIGDWTADTSAALIVRKLLAIGNSDWHVLGISFTVVKVACGSGSR